MNANGHTEKPQVRTCICERSWRAHQRGCRHPQSSTPMVIQNSNFQHSDLLKESFISPDVTV
jgi:hypothetical protein